MSSPTTAGILSKYIKTLSERNALLRQAAASGNISSDMFFHGTHSCPPSEQKILRYRFEYLDMIKKQAAENYSGITAGREKLTVTYDTFCKATDFDEQSAAQTMLDELEKAARPISDASLQAPAAQRRSFIFFINNRNARIYGSQGQQRSCALSLKLAEADILRKKITDEAR